MKNQILSSTIVALTLALSLLGGCASGTGSNGSEAVNVNFEEFYTTVTENHEMQMGLDAITEEMELSFYPGLEDIATKQKYLYASMITLSSQEIGMVEVENEADVQAVKDIFQARIDAQVAGGAWYPQTIEDWKNNSRVVSHGNYVLMVVHGDADEIVEQFDALFA